MCIIKQSYFLKKARELLPAFDVFHCHNYHAKYNKCKAFYRLIEFY